MSDDFFAFDDVTPSAAFPGLVDICLNDNGEPCFLVLTADGLTLQQQAATPGGTVIPPDLGKLPYLLPRAAEVIRWHGQEDATLYPDLLAYLKRFSALDDHQWAIVAHYVALTYLHDHPEIDYCPYLLFYAVPERGKSRTGKSVVYVSFRGVHQIDLRETAIFRFSQHHHATLFFDLLDVWKKAEQNRCEDVLLLRAEKGATVNRVLYPDKGAFHDTEYFSIYGPTIFATNVELHKILDTRCLPIIMPNRPGNYENPRPDLGRELKERLTARRARWLDSPLPPLAPLDGISGRLWDISRPLFQVARLLGAPELDTLTEAILAIAGERSAGQRATVEGHLAAIIREVTDEQDKADSLGWTLKVSDLLRKYNEDRPPDKQVSAPWLGKKLKSMSLTHRTVHGRSEIVLTPGEYQTLLRQYGLDEAGREPHPLPQPLPEKLQANQSDVGVVGSGWESRGEGGEPPAVPLSAAEHAFQELAAILEFQAGYSREEAQREARHRLKIGTGGPRP